MRTKFTKSVQVLTHLTTGRRQEDTAIDPGQLMIIKPTCPCCSDTLLCHIRLGGRYWRCCSCHQEMPV